MKRNNRGILSILVIAILALSFALPFMSVYAALGTPTLDDNDVQVGDVITVSGDQDNVTSGATVKAFWDVAIGDDAWLLNTTTGNPNGSYDLEITVPDTVNGTHYVWIEDTATSERKKSAGITVNREITLDPDSGLPNEDDIEISGTGFSAENEITVVFWNVTGGSGDYNFSEVQVTNPATVETDEYGSFTCTFDVPANIVYGDYKVNASDDVTVLNATADFRVGASLTLTPDVGPEGTVVEIKGRGFNKTGLVTLTQGDILWNGSYPVYLLADADIETNGRFTVEIVVPSFGKGDFEVEVYDGTFWANSSFEIDGAAAIEVEPTYGAPGSTITLNGYNFTTDPGTEVTLTLIPGDEPLGTVDTDANGEFTTTFIAPAVAFGNYDVQAIDENEVNTTDAFKVGLIAMIINPVSGTSGQNVSLTGVGFFDGDFNMTFGDELYEYPGGVASEVLSEVFNVPTVDPGVYDVTVIDEEENELTVAFTVTATTSLTPTPAAVAIGYNMSIYGENYAYVAGTDVEWWVYNSTWVSEDPITVNNSVVTNIQVSEDGNFTGYWTVPDTLLLGNTYTVNATDDYDLYAEFAITIVEEEWDIRPNKLSYSLGDTITFTIKATFEKEKSYLEITDPTEELIFYSLFEADEWYTSGTWKIVRIMNQVNEDTDYPFVIPSDGDIGIWNWTLYDDDDEAIESGTIEVLPTTAAQVDARLSQVEGSLADLADDIAGVTDELGDDISGLSDEIADVASEVDDLKDEIVSDLADDIAGAIDAADAAADAVADLEDTVGDIADVATDAKTAADSAASAADDAATAAEDAKTAATGLTTLVYGAIGASLIAALAAIVSLMQISRKIA